MSEEYLEIGRTHGIVVAVVVFFGVWIYCSITYGFLLGFGIGWLPSAICAFIAFLLTMVLWLPLDLAIAVLIYLIFFKN